MVAHQASSSGPRPGSARLYFANKNKHSARRLGAGSGFCRRRVQSNVAIDLSICPSWLHCRAVVRRLCIIVFALGLAACGNDIGDSCSFGSDCSPNGDRICDTQSPGGYCTVFGCDVDTCPDSSLCVRFFSVASSNLPCDPQTEDRGTDNCTPDEICTLGGSCVPRTAEFRYCMKTCKNDGDCRSEYECRDEELMRAHGGEPVPKPGDVLGENLQSFCAAAPFDN